MKPRQAILGLLLAGALAAAFWPRGEEGGEEEVVEPVRKPAAASAGQPQAAAPARPGPSARPRFAPAFLADLFPSQSFRPPPPPPPKPLPPPPPMAPPLPFSFIGAWSEAGKETVFLAQGERTFTTQKGGKLAGGWRLDELTASALVFTYEPLNQQRTLRIAP